MNDRPLRVEDVSLSFGEIRFEPESALSIEELIAHADQVMYEHKQSKRRQRAESVPDLVF